MKLIALGDYIVGNGVRHITKGNIYKCVDYLKAYSKFDSYSIVENDMCHGGFYPCGIFETIEEHRNKILKELLV